MQHDIRNIKNITIPLGNLLAKGEITEEEAQKLLAMAKPSKASSILRNVLVIFGMLMSIGGLLALNPDKDLGLFLAVSLLGLAYYLHYKHREQWSFIAQNVGALATLGVAAWIAVTFIDKSITDETALFIPISITAALLFITSLTLHNRFLGALFVLNIGHLIGMSTHYWHASYGLSITQPTFAIALYGALAFITYMLSKKASEATEPVLTIMSRTSIFIVNLAFWIGSLWGDYVGADKNYYWRNAAREDYWIHIPELVFGVAWAAALIGCIIWAARLHKGFVVNTSIVFLSIHFYTQYFEIFYKEPLGIMVGGIMMFCTALLWWKYNDQIEGFIHKVVNSKTSTQS